MPDYSNSLFQVLTGRKPFDEVGKPAFRIYWTIHLSVRPISLVQDSSKPNEKLTTQYRQTFFFLL